MTPPQRRAVLVAGGHALLVVSSTAIAVTSRPALDAAGPWFDGGGVFVVGVVIAGFLGIALGLLEVAAVRHGGAARFVVTGVLTAVYTAVTFAAAFAPVSFLTSFNDETPVPHGEWNAAWIYVVLLNIAPAGSAIASVLARTFSRSEIAS